MTAWRAVRPIAWGAVWWTITDWTANALWPELSPWVHYLLCFLACLAANLMARFQSLRWRWLMATQWSRLHRPLVRDEDGRVHGAAMPFEVLHLSHFNNVLVEGHVHTRTLLLGRPTLRAETVWRPDLLREMQ